MTDPYEVLGLSPDADDAAIRRRYLELVRQFPPDRAPERFAAIRSAYDEARDPARRLARQIFEGASGDSLGMLASDLQARLAGARLSVDALLALADLP